MASAIEMAITATLQKMLPSLLERVPEMLANIPPEIAQTIGQIGKSVAAFQAQADRIEANQLAIMAHLGIDPPEPKPEQRMISDGRPPN